RLRAASHVARRSRSQRQRLGEREVGGRGVTVDHPDDPPAVDHRVCIVVPGEERCELAYALDDGAAEEQTAALVALWRGQQVLVTEAPGEIGRSACREGRVRA